MRSFFNLLNLLCVVCLCSCKSSLSPLNIPSNIDDNNAQIDQSHINRLKKTNSIWSNNNTKKDFFFKRNSFHVGDIIKITVKMSDSADFSLHDKFDSKSDLKLDSNSSVPLFNYLIKLFDKNIDFKVGNNISLFSHGNKKKDFSYSNKRKEDAKFEVTSMVRHILPNGNFVISGLQEMILNKKKKSIFIVGIVSPNDISENNKIDYSAISEVRIKYGNDINQNSVFMSYLNQLNVQPNIKKNISSKILNDDKKNIKKNISSKDDDKKGIALLYLVTFVILFSPIMSFCI